VTSPDDASSADGTVWYFAYGSNMQRATFSERRGILPRTSVRGRLDGYRLCFDLPIGPGERGVANLAVDASACVHGVAHLITHEQLDFLDRTEGVDRGHYDRLAVVIRADDEGSLAAVTYLSRHGVAGRKPSARYLGLLLEGARQHGLPADYVAFLEAFELAVDERERP